MDIMEISVYVSVPLMNIQYMEISVSVCKCPFYAHVLRSLYLSVAPLCSYMEISVSVSLDIWGSTVVSVCLSVSEVRQHNPYLGMAALGTPYMIIQ